MEEGPFAEYLRALFVKRQSDLVVAISSPAIGFIQKHREQLFHRPCRIHGCGSAENFAIALTGHDALVVTDVDFN